jgi:hypothetical protein
MTDAVTVKYKDEPLDITPEYEAVRYLGFWATPNGNMKSTMDLVFERTIKAKETIQGHPLGPKQTIEVFAAKAVGNFRYLSRHHAKGETSTDWIAYDDRGTKQHGNSTKVRQITHGHHQEIWEVWDTLQLWPLLPTPSTLTSIEYANRRRSLPDNEKQPPTGHARMALHIKGRNETRS